jgi:zinc-finger-containing domain
MSARKRKTENAAVGDRATIWCAGCQADVQARLTNGAEVYPGRRQFWAQPFWKCDGCGEFVGCHHRHHVLAQRTCPLGIIPTPALKQARSHLHRLIDPLWQGEDAPFNRRDLYAEIAARMSWRTYHTAEVRDIESARAVYRVVLAIKRELAAPKTDRRAA